MSFDILESVFFTLLVKVVFSLFFFFAVEDKLLLFCSEKVTGVLVPWSVETAIRLRIPSSPFPFLTD